MPDKWPLANGNWSSAANWNDGTKPVSGDTVYCDGKTLTIDENVNIGSGTITNATRSGGTAHGSITISGSRTITANFSAGSSSTSLISSIGSGTIINGNVSGSGRQAITSTPIGTLTINGNLTAGSASDSYGIQIIASGSTVIINGNISGGSGSSCPGISSITGTLIVNGFINGGTGFPTDQQYQAWGVTGVGNGANITVTGGVNDPNIGGTVSGGIRITATGSYTIAVTGDVYSGTWNSVNIGIRTVSANTGTITITGNVVARAAIGLQILGTAVVTVNGDAIAGNGGQAVSNEGVGSVVRVNGTAVGNDHGLGSVTSIGYPGVFGGGINSGAVDTTTTVRAVRSGSRGQAGISGRVHIDTTSLANSFAKFRSEPPGLVEYTLATAENLGSLPANSDVRLGTIFNFGTRTGTCAVPGAASVAVGVPTDNTVGTAVITESVLRSALGLASANLDTQLTNKPTLAQIEASSVLAKQSTSTAIKERTDRIPDNPATSEQITSLQSNSPSEAF